MPKKAPAESAVPKKAATKKKATKQAETTPAKAKANGHSNAVLAWVEAKNKEKRFQGKAQISMASQVRTPFNLRRPTGILGLDLELGGGFHAGGMVEIHGAQSAGKTFLTYNTAAQVQKHYGDDANILVVCIEIRMDKNFARMAEFCVPYSEEEIAEYDALRQKEGLAPFTDEDKDDLRRSIGNVVTVAGVTADVALDVVVDALEKDLFQLIIVESLGALLTEDVAEGSTGDAHYAGPSRIVTQFVNKALPMFLMNKPDGSPRETTILGINQARSNIGKGKYDPDTKPAMGAYAWKHGQLVSLELTQGALLREDPNEPPVGRTVRWKTTKGKAGTHDGLRGEYDYYHLPKVEPVFWRDVQETWFGGIAVYNEMVETAKKLGVTEVAGSWVTWGDRRWQGMAKFAQAIAEDPELANALKEECVKKSGLLVRYR
jgi:RecA/RadA recombinase